jgi:hypothetical protein
MSFSVSPELSRCFNVCVYREVLAGQPGLAAFDVLYPTSLEFEEFLNYGEDAMSHRLHSTKWLSLPLNACSFSSVTWPSLQSAAIREWGKQRTTDARGRSAHHTAITSTKSIVPVPGTGFLSVVEF